MEWATKLRDKIEKLFQHWKACENFEAVIYGCQMQRVHEISISQDPEFTEQSS